MSNKTSDNVANIEDDVKIVKEFIDYAQEVIDDMEYERPVDVTVYQKDLTSMANILAELEQKDKRIKELEEELKGRTDNTNKLIEVINLYLNSIPKQAVIDKIEELKKDIKLNNCRYPYILEHKIDVLQELLERRNRNVHVL